MKGYLLIQGIWTQGTDSIHDMRVVNTNAVSHQYKTPKIYLETAEREKKKNYLHACINERRHFTPFVVSVNSLIWVETEATLKRISSGLATKCKKPY